MLNHTVLGGNPPKTHREEILSQELVKIKIQETAPFAIIPQNISTTWGLSWIPATATANIGSVLRLFHGKWDYFELVFWSINAPRKIFRHSALKVPVC